MPLVWKAMGLVKMVVKPYDPGSWFIPQFNREPANSLAVCPLRSLTAL